MITILKILIIKYQVRFFFFNGKFIILFLSIYVYRKYNFQDVKVQLY